MSLENKLKKAFLIGVGALTLGGTQNNEDNVRVTGTLENPVEETVSGKQVSLVDEISKDTLDVDVAEDGSFSLEYETSTGMENPYPNPSDGEVNVEVTPPGEGMYEVGVYNTLGQEVYSRDFELGSGTNKITLEGGLSSGTYIVRVLGNDFNESEKFTTIGSNGNFKVSVETGTSEGANNSSSLAINIDGGELYKDKARPIPYGQNTSEEIILEDELFKSNTSGRAVNENGDEANVEVTKNYQGESKTEEAKGEFELELGIPKRLLNNSQLTYTISGDGYEDKEINRSLEKNIDLGERTMTHTPPEVEVTKPEVEWFGPYDFKINTRTIHGLEEATLEIEGETYTEELTGEKDKTKISHDFSGRGNIPYTIKVTDSNGLEKVIEDNINVDRHEFNVEAKGFFGDYRYDFITNGKETNPDASIKAVHLETGNDTTLTADSQGNIEGVLPEGNYLLDLRSGFQDQGINVEDDFVDWNRLKVSFENHPDENMFWHGDDKTYLVSGRHSSNTKVLFRHEDDFNSEMESLDNVYDEYTKAHFATEELHRTLVDRPTSFDKNIEDNRFDSEHWYRVSVVADVTHPQTLVVNKGVEDNPYDRDDWSAVSRDYFEHPEHGYLPPGTNFGWNDVVEEDELENFENYIEEWKKVMEGDMIGVNNVFDFYTVVEEADSEELQSYLHSWGPDANLVDQKYGVQYFGRSRSVGDYQRGGVRGNRVRNHGDTVELIESSRSFMSGASPMWATESHQFYGYIKARYPPGIGSVRDSQGAAEYIRDEINSDVPKWLWNREGWNPGVVDNANTNPKDRMLKEVNLSWGTFAQQQLNITGTSNLLGENYTGIEYLEVEKDESLLNYVLENNTWNFKRNFPDNYTGFNPKLIEYEEE